MTSIINYCDIDPFSLEKISGAQTKIYFLFSEGALVYVGKTAFIDSRILSHEKEGEKDFNRFSFFSVPENISLKVENYYIQKYKPVYNKRGLNDEKRITKLEEYFKKESSQTHEDFATQIGIHVTTLHRYIRGERVPEDGIMQKLNIATKLEVMPNDFYPI